MFTAMDYNFDYKLSAQEIQHYINSQDQTIINELQDIVD